MGPKGRASAPPMSFVWRCATMLGAQPSLIGRGEALQTANLLIHQSNCPVFPIDALKISTCSQFLGTTPRSDYGGVSIMFVYS